MTDIIPPSEIARQHRRDTDTLAERIRANTPPELLARPQWVTHVNKGPRDPHTGDYASSTDLTTWGPSERALDAVERYGHDGVGFVFSSGDPYVGIDLDNAYDPVQAERDRALGILSNIGVEMWASRIVTRFASRAYIEVSTSGTGVHIVTRGKLRRNGTAAVVVNGETVGKIEMYSTERYFVMTGDVLVDSSFLRDAQRSLDETYADYIRGNEIGDFEGTGAYYGDVFSTGLSDDDVIAKAQGAANSEKFVALFDQGDLREYNGDDSRADMALIGMLAFYCGANPEQIDRLFRRSKLYRTKWDERRGAATYGDSTIGKVIRSRGTDPTDYYGGSRKEPADPDSPSPNGATHETRFNAFELMRRSFRPARFIVDDLIAEGTTVLSGAPKIGKSWLALDIAIAGAIGRDVLGRTVEKPGDVLYLALEDNPRRLKERVEKVWSAHVRAEMPFDAQSFDDDFVIDCSLLPPLPERLDFWTACPTLEQGGLDKVEEWRQAHPDARLLIIDTLQRFRESTGRGSNQYEADYKALAAIQQYSSRTGLSCLIPHHNRKATSDDPLEMVSGSFGVTGAVDGVLVLRRIRGRADAALYVTGRDIRDDKDYALNFDPNTARWSEIGDAADVLRTTEQTQILDVLRKAGESLTPTEVTTRTGQKPGTVKTRLWRMAEDGLIQSDGKGKYGSV